jgi:peptidoglycan/xylan/chitin deacetylase (PgdA/CDA1 family)
MKTTFAPKSALLAASALVLASLAHTSFAQDAPAPGTTRVAPWKDDKKTAFLLMFDDSIPTDFDVVIPELQKRNMVGTFYINPGSPHYLKAKDKWEKELPTIPGVVYGNHTMTHQGLADFAAADTDLAQVNSVILKAFPGKETRLISFAKPGVSKDKWTITEEDYQKALKKNNLIAREPSTGMGAAVFYLKTADDMIKHLDGGIATGKIKSILFHGVGGDWLVTPTDMFTTFLDNLATKRDQVWITDHISAHKYQTEMASAKVNVLESAPKKIRLELKDDADSQLYDGPLTLITQVPAAWDKVQVVQGTAKTTVTANKGQLMFDAIPDGAPITLTPAA